MSLETVAYITPISSRYLKVKLPKKRDGCHKAITVLLNSVIMDIMCLIA